MPFLRLPIIERSCGTCTKCCEGWLEGNVHGHKMHRGCNCFYLEKTCRIYEDRPENPCRNYNCSWLTEETFPGWMKPELTNTIITKRKINVPTQDGMNSYDYYDVIEAGGKLDSTVLNWLVHWSLETKNNVVYELDGKRHVVGEDGFTSFASKRL